jgi:hypothetical protein
MPSLPDASLSILAADLQVNSTPWAAIGGLFLVVATGSIYYASPQRLTHVLVDAMANVKKAYLEAIENGALCTTDAHTAETFARYAFHPLLFYTFPVSTAESEREKYYVGILEVIEQGSDRAGAVAS